MRLFAAQTPYQIELFSAIARRVPFTRIAVHCFLNFVYLPLVAMG